MMQDNRIDRPRRPNVPAPQYYSPAPEKEGPQQLKRKSLYLLKQEKLEKPMEHPLPIASSKKATTREKKECAVIADNKREQFDESQFHPTRPSSSAGDSTNTGTSDLFDSDEEEKISAEFTGRGAERIDTRADNDKPTDDEYKSLAIRSNKEKDSADGKDNDDNDDRGEERHCSQHTVNHPSGQSTGGFDGFNRQSSTAVSEHLLDGDHGYSSQSSTGVNTGQSSTEVSERSIDRPRRPKMIPQYYSPEKDDYHQSQKKRNGEGKGRRSRTAGFKDGSHQTRPERVSSLKKTNAVVSNEKREPGLEHDPSTEQKPTECQPPQQMGHTHRRAGYQQRMDDAEQDRDRWSQYRTTVNKLCTQLMREAHVYNVLTQQKREDAGSLASHAAALKVLERPEVKKTIEKEFRIKVMIREAILALAGENADDRVWSELEEEDEDGLVDVDCVVCSKCGKSDEVDNDILFCDRTGCNRAYHQNCLDPPVSKDELEKLEEDWFCRQCECLDDCLDLIGEHTERDFSFAADVFAEVRNGSSQESKLDLDAHIHAEDDEDDEDDEDFGSDDGDGSADDLLDSDDEDAVRDRHVGSRVTAISSLNEASSGDGDDEDDDEQDRAEGCGEECNDEADEEDDDDDDDDGDSEVEDDEIAALLREANEVLDEYMYPGFSSADTYTHGEHTQDSDEVVRGELRRLPSRTCVTRLRRGLKEQAEDSQADADSEENLVRMGANVIGTQVARNRRGMVEFGEVVSYLSAATHGDGISSGTSSSRDGNDVISSQEIEARMRDTTSTPEKDASSPCWTIIFKGKHELSVSVQELRGYIKEFKESEQWLKERPQKPAHLQQDIVKEIGLIDEANVITGKRKRKILDYSKIDAKLLGLPDEDEDEQDDDFLMPADNIDGEEVAFDAQDDDAMDEELVGPSSSQKKKTAGKVGKVKRIRKRATAINEVQDPVESALKKENKSKPRVSFDVDFINANPFDMRSDDVQFSPSSSTLESKVSSHTRVDSESLSESATESECDHAKKRRRRYTVTTEQLQNFEFAGSDVTRLKLLEARGIAPLYQSREECDSAKAWSATSAYSTNSSSSGYSTDSSIRRLRDEAITTTASPHIVLSTTDADAVIDLSLDEINEDAREALEKKPTRVLQRAPAKSQRAKVSTRPRTVQSSRNRSSISSSSSSRSGENESTVIVDLVELPPPPPQPVRRFASIVDFVDLTG